MVLNELGNALAGALRKLGDHTVVDEEVMDTCLKEVTKALLQADVNVQHVVQMKKNIVKSVNINELAAGLNAHKLLEKEVFKELCRMLDGGVGANCVPHRITSYTQPRVWCTPWPSASSSSSSSPPPLLRLHLFLLLLPFLLPLLLPRLLLLLLRLLLLHLFTRRLRLLRLLLFLSPSSCIELKGTSRRGERHSSVPSVRRRGGVGGLQDQVGAEEGAAQRGDVRGAPGLWVGMLLLSPIHPLNSHETPLKHPLITHWIVSVLP